MEFKKKLGKYVWKYSSMAESKFEITVNQGLCNNFGILHGGAAHLLCQHFSLVQLAYINPQADYETISLHLTFMSPARLNDILTVNTRYTCISPTIRVSFIEIFEKSQIVAKATHSILLSNPSAF